MKPQTSHIIIAGTGRTGTSFLVRYLAELGMGTHLSHSETPMWDEDAQAGLEDSLFVPDASILPYVIKSAWIFEYIDQILAREDIKIDCAILPVRDLIKVATSRTIVQMRARYQSAPWMADLDQSWETWGMTPGGTVFSLNPLDQARILAVGFHRVVERLTAADIPTVFLAFPRFVENGDYLYDKLKNYLPVDISPDQARVAHGRVADATKVRVEKELLAEASTAAPHLAVQPGARFPESSDLDRISLRRELHRLQRENSKLASVAERRATEAHDLIVERDSLIARCADLQSRQDALIAERDALAVQQNAERGALRVRHDGLSAKYDAPLASHRSWMSTPLRALQSLLARRLPR